MGRKKGSNSGISPYQGNWNNSWTNRTEHERMLRAQSRKRGQLRGQQSEIYIVGPIVVVALVAMVIMGMVLTQ